MLMSEAAMRAAAVTPVAAAEEGASVRLATHDDRPKLGGALADAFYEDPVLSWVFRDEGRRREELIRGFNLYHRRFWADSDLTYTTGQIVGACAWLAPGKWHASIASQLRAMPGMLRAFGPRDLVRLMRLLNVIESDHPHDEHYYLQVVGVATAWQGKGLGSALMRPVLERCDREGTPAYLEASSERNRDLYLRHGFEVTGELSCPDDGPPLWQMWRKPASAA
jgi:GNAT superfamily N-acetyltransferase